MSTPSDQVEAIVDAALDLPVLERAAYLDKACGDDAPLRQLVEALLHAHERAPAPCLPAKPAPPPLVSEQPGDKIGRYKLIQQIGEGGMGVVYMAEQEEPVRRRVALKVIKLGMDTKSVIARFEAERQALALMDHPNIAKVFDAGATDTGRPYFVMELVHGIRITDYCDQNHLSMQQRLGLFTQVCQAIQHAHQKGIIHRDIKPSNILVTLHDGVPVPKIIDFGIAKATTDQRLTDKTFFTALQQFIGTPAYMSPEQAELTGLDIDTRSDIYSLGVLLYELLTGKTPFEAKELLAAGLDAMRRTIREQEPSKPSTRLSAMGMGDTADVTNRFKMSPTKLAALVRGDLDWIVMKALEKDRARRYETASGLATDIQRHLTNEPVMARPTSNLYRFQKIVLRNKLAFAAITAVSASLIIGFCISMWLFAKERQALHRALAAEKKLQVQFTTFQLASQQAALIEATREHLVAMARLPQARRTNSASFDSFFVHMKSVFTNYDDFGLIDTNGVLIGSSFGHAGSANLTDRDYFQRVLWTRNFATGEIQKGDGSRKPTLPFGVPVFDEKGMKVVRVLYAALDLAVLISPVAQAQVPKGGEIGILDRRGRFLARFPEPEKWIGKDYPEPNILAAILAKKVGFIEMRGLDGIPRFYGFAPYGSGEDVRFFVVVVVPISVDFAEQK